MFSSYSTCSNRETVQDCLNGRRAEPSLVEIDNHDFGQTNKNRLPRLDRRITTLRVDSLQDITYEGYASVMVDGGVAIGKGTRLGELQNRIPGTIGYQDNQFVAVDEDGCLNQILIAPTTSASACPPPEQTVCIYNSDATITTQKHAFVRKSGGNVVDVWITFDDTFDGEGSVALPACSSVCQPLNATLNYTPDPMDPFQNDTRPLIYDATTQRFHYHLNNSSDVYIYNIHIQYVSL